MSVVLYVTTQRSLPCRTFYATTLGPVAIGKVKMPSRPLPIATRRGRRAERVAKQHVLALGMSVIACNLRVGYLELDIVARHGRHMVIIEVRGRARLSWQGALDSVGHRKRERLRRAATILWARHWHRDRRLVGVRFDVISVDLECHPPLVTYLRAAF